MQLEIPILLQNTRKRKSLKIFLRLPDHPFPPLTKGLKNTDSGLTIYEFVLLMCFFKCLKV